MRQVLFMLGAAMMIAFSLSWASSGADTELYYSLPDNILLPEKLSLHEQPEILATFTLKNSCEVIENVDQEQSNDQIIFSVHTRYVNNHLCLEETRYDVSLNLKIDKYNHESSRHLDVFFREDDKTIRYFGAIDAQELLSKN